MHSPYLEICHEFTTIRLRNKQLLLYLKFYNPSNKQTGHDCRTVCPCISRQVLLQLLLCDHVRCRVCTNKNVLWKGLIKMKIKLYSDEKSAIQVKPSDLTVLLI